MRYLILFAMLLILAGAADALDTNPPLIYSINVVDILLDRATVIWYTDEPSTSFIETDGSAVNDTSLITNHNVRLVRLAPGSEYLYNITSCDATGNCAKASGNALKFTTMPLFLGEEKDLAESNASRLIRASSSKAYLLDFREQNPFKGSFGLRSGFLFSINGSDRGFIVTKISDSSAEITLVPNTNISFVKLNTTRAYDLDDDTKLDVEFGVEGIGKSLVVGEQEMRYIEYYANISIKSLHQTEEKVAEKARVDFDEEIVPYKFPSGPDKEGKIDILSRLLPKEGGSAFIGALMFVIVLAAGLLILWLVRQ